MKFTIFDDSSYINIDENTSKIYTKNDSIMNSVEKGLIPLQIFLMNLK